jgi:hypothetical protein
MGLEHRDRLIWGSRRTLDEGVPFLSAQNVKPYKFMPENHRKVSLEDYLGYTRHTKPERGDILMTRVGAMIGDRVASANSLQKMLGCPGPNQAAAGGKTGYYPRRT